jgi:hypothetical protein
VGPRICLKLCGEKIKLSVAGTRTWAVKSVAISTELSRFLYIIFMESVLIGNLTVVAIHRYYVLLLILLYYERVEVILFVYLFVLFLLLSVSLMDRG